MDKELLKLMIRRSLPYGVRLLKARPTITWKDPTARSTIQRYPAPGDHEDWYPQYKEGRTFIRPTVTKKCSLENHDFQFFLDDSAPTSTLDCARCRVCDVILWNGVSDRKKHLKSEGCAKKLIFYAKKIFPAKRCVVCAAPSTLTSWGFNFCSNACVGKFRTSFRLPYEIRAAIKLLKV